MTRIFEDGFESGDLSKWSSFEGDVTVEKTHPTRGLYNARFRTPGGAGRARVIAAINVTEAYARGYFHVASDLTFVDRDDRFSFISFAVDHASPFTSFGIGQGAAGPQFRLVTMNGRDPTTGAIRYAHYWVPVEVATPQKGKDYCIEIHVKMGVGDGLVEVWIDGEKVARLNGLDNTVIGPAILSLGFGIWAVEAGAINLPSIEVLGDCFVIADTYIGPEAVVSPPIPIWKVAAVVLAVFGSVGAIVAIKAKK